MSKSKRRFELKMERDKKRLGKKKKSAYAKKHDHQMEGDFSETSPLPWGRIHQAGYVPEGRPPKNAKEKIDEQ